MLHTNKKLNLNKIYINIALIISPMMRTHARGV